MIERLQLERARIDDALARLEATRTALDTVIQRRNPDRKAS
nr:hypothetical protein [Kibdelosporangium sp. MJ126-NF4]CEL20942.1 hypothetical protein [Kibdelosporangium sp. MJ126-NF4]CTQ95544.1 hypothetical protein [Kibdelosporangium sp. MJ126-NF4]